MPEEPERRGRRERKKLETRQRIQDAAIDLFDARGFEQVTVAEVARAAEVSPATVFNYFSSKDDLIFHGMSAYGRQLVADLRARRHGVSVLEAFRAHLTTPRGALASDDRSETEMIARVRGIIADSPALRARELLIAEATAGELAELLAEELGTSSRVQTRSLAAALVGVERSMTLEIHRLAAEGLSGTEIAAAVFPPGAAAVDVLIRGLAADSDS